MIGVSAAAADAVEDFYKGKTITIVTSTGVGGPFDLTARALAKHMVRYIPGRPTMIVRNMPGGGHVLATNFMYQQAEKDGTVIATVNNSVPLHQVLGGQGVRYDARRFYWLGSTGTSNLMTVAWHTSGFKTMDDVMQRELIIGATGIGSGTFIYPNAMNIVLGTKFKIVMGYKSTAELDLAMERGEVAARAGASLAGILQERPTWIEGNQGGRAQPDRRRARPGVSAGAADARAREDHRAAADPDAAVAAAGARAAVLHHARRAGRARRRAAARIRGDHEGRDVPEGGQQLNLEMNPFGGERAAAIVNDTINVPRRAGRQGQGYPRARSSP